VPDQKMVDLCTRISAEKDHKKLIELTDELIKLLTEEQDAIRAKIKANLSKSVGGPF
jgi:hypothetical protein